jgi:hypothetical protein
MNLLNGWEEDKETLSSFKAKISFTFLSFSGLVHNTAQILTDSRKDPSTSIRLYASKEEPDSHVMHVHSPVVQDS